MTRQENLPRLISADELRAIIGYEDLIEPVSLAFQRSSAGKADNGLIVLFPATTPKDGDVYVKTGVLHGHDHYLVKVSPWFAENLATGAPQGGFMAVFDSRTGHTLAIINEQHYLSDIRTAAAGALAARVFAPVAVHTAVVLGSGTQAFWQARALFGERPYGRLLIWARDPKKAQALAERLFPVLPGVDITIALDAEQAVRQADVIVTATLARNPILRRDWLRPGQHITAVGADDATKCELDVETLQAAKVFVDSVETTLANGCVHRAISLGKYLQSQISGEIGDVLAGRIPGRQTSDEITVAKFVGLGVQDLAAATAAIRLLSP